MLSSEGMHISDKLHVSYKKKIFLLGDNIIPSCAFEFQGDNLWILNQILLIYVESITICGLDPTQLEETLSRTSLKWRGPSCWWPKWTIEERVDIYYTC